MSQANYGVFNAMTDIVFSPARALDAVKDHTRWLWWPLLISITLACAAFVYYYTWVDFDWLVDQTVQSIPAEDRADAEGAIRGFMSPTTSIVTTVLAVTIMTLLIYTIQSVYLNLVNKLTSGPAIGFGQWFSFSAWTAFVGIFSSLGIFMSILLADSNRLGQDQLVPLSMNSLFIHAEMGDPWFNWGNSLTLINFWMIGLMALGYSRWTGASMLKSTLIVALPWVLIFGTWAALI